MCNPSQTDNPNRKGDRIMTQDASLAGVNDTTCGILRERAIQYVARVNMDTEDGAAILRKASDLVRALARFKNREWIGSYLVAMLKAEIKDEIVLAALSGRGDDCCELGKALSYLTIHYR
jgi:hypothetical protein